MQKFKSEKNNIFIKEINKTVLSLNAYKIMQSVDSIEICAQATSKDLVNEKEEIKGNNAITRYKNN